MELHFYKYQGTGNDFILLDNRKQDIQLTKEQVALLCHRRFGIGADGLMLLEAMAGYDFRMVYYNSDGGLSTMCGNGGRCIAAFAKRLNVVKDVADFMAIDGPHKATILMDDIVSLHMNDVSEIKAGPDHFILDTGSPHYVKFVNDVQAMDVFHEGRTIRNLPEFAEAGINVNFVEKLPDSIWVRTYERGVEDETYSCGTGVTAAAIAANINTPGHSEILIHTPGGDLEVSFNNTSVAGQITDVILKGPVQFVFEGDIEL